MNDFFKKHLHDYEVVMTYRAKGKNLFGKPVKTKMEKVICKDQDCRDTNIRKANE